MAPLRATFLALGVLCGGCGTDPLPLPAEQVCAEAASVIATRTLACTGDVDLAQARHERFDEQFTCNVPDTTEETSPSLAELFECPADLQRVECADIETFGDDLASWVATSSRCGELFGAVGGTP